MASARLIALTMVKKIYLDNAATTCIDPLVADEMIRVIRDCYGNPSSIHGHGREARAVIEKARKKIADLLHASPAEIFFTSGGTEADNMAIRCSVEDLGIRHIISSRIEHHAVTHTLEALEKKGKAKVSWIKIDAEGHVDLDDLRRLLSENERSLVSLMHGNNEIGTMIPLAEIGNICKEYDAIFHSDTVQTMAHFPFDLRQLYVHFVTCSAHKFHGPKGIGFLYVNSGIRISPYITGGAQERNMRAGTENIYGIAGLAKAFELAHEHMEEHHAYILGLKNYMKERLEEEIDGVRFNGDCSDNSLYTILNVCFPPSPDSEMFLMKLDIMGISASGGSACSSGSNVGSHVLTALGVPENRPNIRFSFSRFNTKEEIDYVMEVLKKMYSPKPAHV